MQQGFVDWILGRFFLDPYRCGGCAHRYFRFRYGWAKFVTPILVFGFLGIIAIGGLNGPHWLKSAKQSLTGSLVKPQPPATPKVTSR